MMSPDTVSSLFPDRPIRPLPKRRLRERLSPEAADSIRYPVSTRENAPFFHYPPYTVKEAKEGSSQLTSVLSDPIQPGRLDDSNRGVTSQRYGVQSEAGEEGHIGARSTLVARTSPEILNLSGRQAARQEQPRQVEPQPPPSATPSLDGYDSFENTNNKKKRKIPSAGESSTNGTHGHGSEMNGLGLSAATSPPADADHGTERSYAGSNTYQASTSYAAGNQGFSGPGRGRLGRSGNARTPLRTLPDGNTTWTSRGAKAGTTHWPAGSDSVGIISSAIANAGKLPPQGQENVSLLQQHSSASKSTPASAQFTFTCDSQVPGTVQWPGNHSRDDIATHGPDMHSNTNMNNSTSNDISQAATSSQSLRRTRRQLDRELKMAARRRRQIAEENLHENPPKPEDVWICEFCEYERIFGEPPKVLIRAFEIKDRRHRRKEADWKRLMEKAKAKSRKSKKPNKALNKGSSSGHHHPDHMPSDYIDDHQAPSMHHEQSHSTQSEEECDDGLADDQVHPQLHPLHQEGDGGGTSEQEQAES
ncbi:hypothetical protein J3458_009434 [Metarhizium acridum]|uniref:Uncharacterized protein n=2 Tax=Metarhizium acridum TaxID=92637 RepID=E9DTJ0_METAQ|nr:uncharacterized protein MAC_00828 [Metarhizium acridum CQMa 102]EFY93045.1 hypothetical protein MAC_00828 [Metarhizium acridum CQMa 102]KAG8415601.1 hypothetical protein J3458_009434 [Metarhizium acridum]